MTFLLNEMGYFSFNKILSNRFQLKLENEKIYYRQKTNYFPLSLDLVKDDFMVNITFENTNESFKEYWLTYPFKLESEYTSSFVIESAPIKNTPDFLNIFRAYGFEYSGKLGTYFFEEDFETKLVGYLRSYIPSFSRYDVSVYYDAKNKIMTIESYFQSGNGIKIYLLEEGYWLIPCMPEKQSFTYDLCEVVNRLLSHYDLISIFGQKK